MWSSSGWRASSWGPSCCGSADTFWEIWPAIWPSRWSPIILALRFFTNLRLVDLGMWWNRAPWRTWDSASWEAPERHPWCWLRRSSLGRAHLRHAAGPAILRRNGLRSLPAGSGRHGRRAHDARLRVPDPPGERAARGPPSSPCGSFIRALHTANPNATRLGIANTAGFGILFGYAFVRSRDLWLPAGLHFGWNVTFALFGVNVSGLRMKMTGHEMVWSAGKLWSGGDYGPEASVLTSMYDDRAGRLHLESPIRRQPSPLTDPPVEPKEDVCEP
jgi:hypothetical protein